MNTRNLKEIQHFQTLSKSWWDEKGPFRLLHTMTPLRMTFLTEKIKISFYGGPKRRTSSKKIDQDSPCAESMGGKKGKAGATSLQGLRILDVGCGGGLMCEPLARLGAEVIGIDPVDENLVEARAHAEEGGLSIRYLPYAIEDLPEDFPKVDVIVASEILEHVDNPDEFLRACASRLKPGGGLFLSTLNKTPKSYLLGIVAAEYVLRWAPVGTHSWEKFVSPHVLSKTLLDLGFTYQDVQGVSLSPLTQRWRFSSSLDINYFLWAKRSIKTG